MIVTAAGACLAATRRAKAPLTDNRPQLAGELETGSWSLRIVLAVVRDAMPMKIWLIGVGFAGLAAGVLSAALLWLLVTRPVAVARMLGEW